MRVRIDRRLTPQAERVAQAVADALAPAMRGIEGTTYLGAGAADLVHADDPRPHVMVPLTTDGKIDSVARRQIAAADAVIAMDREEVVRLRSDIRGVIVVIDPRHDSARAVIHTASPFDAAEVTAFLSAAPALAATLGRLDLNLRPFDTAVVVEAVIEAAMAATLDSVG
jgi:hypothetical protein